MHRFKNSWWRLVFFWGERMRVHACTQTYTSPQRTRTRQSSMTGVWCCTWQSVRQYRKTHLASPFMSPLLLRYIVTANMKSGLFCQKCVNKHGNTSSEGHNSILHDKCSESAVAFRFSHKITEQTKFGCHRLKWPDSNFFFFSRQTVATWLQWGEICTAVRQKIICNICESTSKKKKKKKRGKSSIFVPQKTNTLDAHI